MTGKLHVRLALTATIIAFGTSKLLAQLFLAHWELMSEGHSDIAARGVWLLGMLLPQIAIAGIVISLVTVVALTRRIGPLLSTRVVPATLGSIVGAAMVVLGADPIAFGLQDLSWRSSLGYFVVSAVLAALLIFLGVVATCRVARGSEIVTAAV
jgi:hypothetical protein